MSVFERNRKDLEDLCKRRFVFRQGSEIYGGVSGFFTYGPPGCALKTNIIQQWRNHFVIEEALMEIEDTYIMPRPVLKASGHVDRFSDFLVRDVKDEKKFFRADKLLEDVMDAKLNEKGITEAVKKEYTAVRNQADAYSQEELYDVFKKYAIKSPDNGNDLTEPEPFNLMFPVPIGPAGLIQGFLRPETAQGIFLNYKFCLEQNANRLPFGCAQIGKSFRNEIAPRAGLTRQREFTQAEIEYFVKPTDKRHPKFAGIKKTKLLLFSSDRQLKAEPHEEVTIGDAVSSGMVNNETLGYFMVRTFTFLTSIGIRPEHCRFRQHLPTEMAHYACDCWDAEIETCYGWLECVGIADRACFDLNAHAEAAKVDLAYREALETPIEREVTEITKAAGIAVMKDFKKAGRLVKEWLEKLSSEDLRALNEEVNKSGQATRNCSLSDGSSGDYTFLPNHVVCQTKKEKQTTTTFMPGVVEPSFGIDRILFSVLEHAYYARPKEEGDGDKQTRGVLAFSATVAPYKLTILPQDQRIARENKYEDLKDLIRKRIAALGHSSTVDDSAATLGKRYARNDELGIPFACTVDFDSLKDECVTLRERDSMRQVRLKADKVGGLLHDLCTARKSWQDVLAMYPS
uniref:glycine--tRNA ligase n=1 Tax=Zooxanthella nutricula TaxID=1333877 RepID=A0A7S2K6A6_9DINO